jgi:hypothetical protein
MDDQSGEVKESDGNCWLVNIEEVLGKGCLVHIELELEIVLAWLSDGLLTGGL